MYLLPSGRFFHLEKSAIVDPVEVARFFRMIRQSGRNAVTSFFQAQWQPEFHANAIAFLVASQHFSFFESIDANDVISVAVANKKSDNAFFDIREIFDRESKGDFI